MRSPKLWTNWLQHDEPRTLLIPDGRDGETHHHFFYGMPTVHRHGVFWGALEVFRLNDLIHSELITSRDAIHWQRLPNRPKMIAYGEDGAWDDTMIFASPAWVEVGDEWWFYYTGWDGPHGTPERDGTVGLATCKRERLFSLRGPAGGGVVCTRTLIWPGGDLWLNLDLAAEGAEATVRISDRRRKPREGFDHADCAISAEDETRSRVTWRGKSLAELAGQDGSAGDLPGVRRICSRLGPRLGIDATACHWPLPVLELPQATLCVHRRFSGSVRVDSGGRWHDDGQHGHRLHLRRRGDASLQRSRMALCLESAI